MKTGDVVSMRSCGSDLPIGLIVNIQQKDKWDDFDNEWCTILWDDGDLTSCWGDELTEVLCKTNAAVV